MALLAEVDKGISQETVGRFKCAVRTVQSINQTGRTSKSRPTQHGAAASRIARGNSNAYIVRDTHYIGENLVPGIVRVKSPVPYPHYIGTTTVYLVGYTAVRIYSFSLTP